ncbi:cytochrome P450 [Cyathus striatus]|nr:cytochrome P450 [Cyathus striatus]
MPFLISLVIALFLPFLLFKRKISTPGPPTYPVLGNLPSLPLKDLQFKFTEWANYYGDVYSLKLGSTTMIVLSSIDAIRYVIEKNTALTSDRPPNHIANAVTGEHQPYALLNQRRAMHELLRMQACLNYIPMQKAEVYQFSNFMQHVRRMTFSSIITIVYGLRVPKFDSPLCKEFHHNVDSFLSLLRPGSQLPVDIFPVLKHVPFAPWKKIAKDVNKRQKNFSYRLLEMVEKRVARGEGNECFMEVLLEKGGNWGLGRELINYLGQALLDGSSDTSSGTLETFILLMTAYPEVFKKAQQEIDTAIGPDRLPALEDINKLPYVVAAILEASRFRPLNPVGVPHYTTGPIKYNNYVIPENSTLILNMWAIFHDGNTFLNAEEYDPERLLNNPEAAKIIDYAFGAGRRICPGIHYAKNTVYLTVMTFLWGFNLSKARDAAGIEIEVDLDAFEERVAVEPKPFKCNIKPRSSRHAEMLFSEFHTAQRDVRAFEVDMGKEDIEYLRSIPKEYQY